MSISDYNNLNLSILLNNVMLIFKSTNKYVHAIYNYLSASSSGTVLSCSKSILFPAMTSTISDPNIFLSSFTQFFTCG